MFDTQSALEKDATLYTSLPPRIVRSLTGQDVSQAYQRACIYSWRERGFDVVSLNSRAEIDLLSEAYPEITFREVPGDRPRIVDFLAAIQQSARSFAGIINADCMLLANDNAVRLSLEGAERGLVLAERFNISAEDGRATGTRCFGFDLMFLRKEAVTQFVFDDQITIGTPWWDYWLPLAFQQAGGRLFALPAPILLHLDHHQNWSWKNWFAQGRRAYFGLASSNGAAKFPLPFFRDSGWPLSEAEVHLFSNNAFSWLRKTSAVLQTEEPSARMLFSFLSAIDVVPGDLAERSARLKQLAEEKAATETALREAEEKLRQIRGRTSSDMRPDEIARNETAENHTPRGGDRVGPGISTVKGRRVAIVIPSRLATASNGLPFLARAIAAGRAQTISSDVDLNFYVGIDPDGEIPVAFKSQPDVTFIHSHAHSQAAAINAAAAAALAQGHDFVALLEDDDRWEPNFLACSLAVLETCDFVSSNQLEVDLAECCIRVNDFPTPSGWIMARDLWQRVGPFDESLRWHIDNDWLGRLALSEARRVHLVEATAPVTIEACGQVRPWIANVLTHGGPRSTVRRHLSSRPLVQRMVHPGSGMHRIGSDHAAAAQSQSEYQQLVARYGRIPW